MRDEERRRKKCEVLADSPQVSREQEFSKMHLASFLRAREVAFCKNIVCESKAFIMMKVLTKLL